MTDRQALIERLKEYSAFCAKHSPQVSELVDEATAALSDQWIPVSERLPEADSDDSYLARHESRFADGVYHTSIVDWIDGKWNYPRPVTHWQPLPEPPRGLE